MMKKKIESPFRKLRMLLVLPLAAMIFYAFAVPEYQYGSDQNTLAPDGKTMNVKGQVLKADGTTPLPGTSVILRGSTIGTITDQDGNFLIKGIPADGELVFSFVGFKSKVQKVDGQPMKIVMEGRKVGIEGVVVTGYANGTPPPPPILDLAKWAQNENPPLIYLDGKIITMAEMANINRDQVESVSVLKDKSAIDVYGEKGKNGVVMIVTKENAGNKEVAVVGYGKQTQTKPPSTFTIPEIDNAKPPLYFLDGVPIDKKTMNKINPETIKSISVLKDKSAIEKYGEGAKNGVILIKSKAKSGNNTDSNADHISDKNSDSQKVYAGDGVNPPIYIVDGVLTDPKTMTLPKPDQIESISVLKGETSVALYGEKGKNGVILIKTKGNNAPLEFTTEKIVIQDGQVVFTVVEEMPEFPGGEMALRSFIGRTIKYPADAIKEGIQGKVFVTFVVKSDGTIGAAKIARGVHPLLDNEAIRVINLLPAWKPGKQADEAVSVSYTVPVTFSLDGSKAKQTASSVAPRTPQKGEKQVFIVVEEMPEFPGGSIALRTFIAKAIKYPTEAQKDKIQGKVFVSFVVNSQGKVEQAKIERSVSPALDAEAIRVVNSLPDWKPGKQRGQAVSVAYTIPIEFKVQ